MKTIQLYIDGACSGNPGQAAIGVVVMNNGQVIKEISESIGSGTNNIAEYTALIYGLQEAFIMRADTVSVCTDSELLCNQIIGTYKVKNPNLKFLYFLARHLVDGFKSFTIKAIPREKNREADILAKKAIKKQAAMVAPMFDIREESPSSTG